MYTHKQGECFTYDTVTVPRQLTVNLIVDCKVIRDRAADSLRCDEGGGVESYRHPSTVAPTRVARNRACRWESSGLQECYHT